MYPANVVSNKCRPKAARFHTVKRTTQSNRATPERRRCPSNQGCDLINRRPALGFLHQDGLRCGKTLRQAFEYKPLISAAKRISLTSKRSVQTFANRLWSAPQHEAKSSHPYRELAKSIGRRSQDWIPSLRPPVDSDSKPKTRLETKPV